MRPISAIDTVRLCLLTMMQNKLYSFAGIVFKIVVPWEMAESEQFSSFEVHGAEPDFIIDVNAGRVQDYEHE